MRVLALILSLLVALPTQADEIVGGLSQNRVELTANFSGSEILIFGAIRHTDTPADDRPVPPESEVIIVVEGPREQVAVWRRSRVAGVWMNTDSATMLAVPSFYAVATSRPLNEILSPEADAEHRISTRQAVRADLAPENALFVEALIRIRERADQFLSLDRFVTIDRDILFRTVVRLPANLTEGAYTTRMYLVRDGVVLSQYRTAIFVRKDGIERWLHQMAYDQPLLYGIMALVLALVAGWGAAALVQLVRQR